MPTISRSLALGRGRRAARRSPAGRSRRRQALLAAAACRRRRRRDRARRPTGRRCDRPEPLPEKAGVGLELLVGRLVGLCNPPGEERVVAVVEAEPAAERAAQAVDGRQGAVGDGPLHSVLALARSLLERALGFADRLGQAGSVAGDLRPVHRLELPPRRLEVEDRLREGDERRDLASLLGSQLELAKLVRQVVLEEQVVDLAVLAKPVEVELAEPVEPLFVETAQPLVAPSTSRAVPSGA